MTRTYNPKRNLSKSHIASQAVGKRLWCDTLCRKLRDDGMPNRDGLNQGREENWASPNGPYEKEGGISVWGAVLFGLIGATATTYAVGQLRQRVDWFRDSFQQIKRTQTSWRVGTSHSFWKSFQEEGWRKYQHIMREEYEEHMGRAAEQLRRSVDWFRDFRLQINRTQSSWKGGASHSFRQAFQEEARRKYMRRMREEYEDEMERVERIKRMQSVFNRERNKNKRVYESWKESGPSAYHQHTQREDWYWKADTSFRDQRTPNYSLSHHYAVLGLSRSPANPYTEAEIKSAFRAKAMQFHPDQNQDGKEAAEAKFKQVLVSYEAIKSETKNMKP